MAMIFIDGFDEYTNPSSKWDGVGALNQGSNDLTGTKSRTGLGCYVTQGPFGPFKNVNNLSNLIIGVAYLIQTSPGGQVFELLTGGVAGSLQQLVGVNSNGSIYVQVGGATFYTSAPGVIIAGVYAYVEFQVHVATVGGSFTLRVNGNTVLSQTGINTDPAAAGSVDTVEIRGAGGGGTCFFDDFYLFDTTGAANNSFAGPVRVYTALPTSDNTPLLWTPSTGTVHFSLVNGVPAESQTTYVFDAGVGNSDDYLYNLTNVPASVTILGVQHGVDAFLDAAGAGSVGSDCATHVSGSTALSTSPHIYSFPRDTDPVVAGPWTLANLINRQFGPNRTA